MPRQTVVIIVPTCYEDPEQARRAVEPYVRDMRVVARIAKVRDTRAGDDGKSACASEQAVEVGDTSDMLRSRWANPKVSVSTADVDDLGFVGYPDGDALCESYGSFWLGVTEKHQFEQPDQCGKRAVRIAVGRERIDFNEEAAILIAERLKFLSLVVHEIKCETCVDAFMAGGRMPSVCPSCGASNEVTMGISVTADISGSKAL